MKTTVVPAQITTVEDKIAGSLTMPQIVLLVISLIAGSAIYAVVSPKMHLGSIKTALILIQFMFFGGLAIRINGKILGEWLVIYLRFRSRPKQYVFTKNDLISRDIPTGQEYLHQNQETSEKTIGAKKTSKPLTLMEELDLKKVFENDSFSISFKPSKKGGLNVSLKQKKD